MPRHITCLPVLLKSDHMSVVQLGVMFDIAASQPMKQIVLSYPKSYLPAFGHGGIGDLTLYLSVLVKALGVRVDMLQPTGVSELRALVVDVIHQECMGVIQSVHISSPLTA